MDAKNTAAGSYGKVLAGLLAIIVYIILTNLPTPANLPPQGQKALAFMVAVVIVWVFEVIPIGISAALFLMIMDILKVFPMKDAMANFATTTLFFILSAFIIAITFINTGLGNRVSLMVSAIFGQKTDRVLLSFMLPTAIISSVLADIPTAVIFSSIAYPLLQKNGCLPGKSNFGKALMLGIPIAAAIGGIATPAGSGLNIMSISLLKNTAGVEINFLQWALIGFPMAILLTLAAWYIVLKFYPPEFDHVRGLEDIAKARQDLGPLTVNEKKFIAIFSVTLVLWFTQPWNHIDPSVVAIITASSFFLPGVKLATWDDVKGKLSWDVLLLLGTANSLAMAIWQLKGAAWLANTVLGGLAGVGLLIVLFAVTAFGIFSHLIIPVGGAVVAVAIPVLAVLAKNTGINPALLVIPIAYTASCVFLLPLDPIPLTTYHYKYWKFWDMMKPGFFISLVWLVLMVIFMYIGQGVGIIR
ncbi:sodium-dependent dicarboxylate transporter SdcS [Moorella thermoacetica]|uniref:Sodium-dependent dicarboxylate transporter SdcS n=1 Tax=Neomoorella thermoacetica TaxID=1525 RepID=A0A1J5JSQ9_NEOTH|nr:DASS family sodium-coupled anion symporter [Moorella thermoacetica]OIQ07599.1 sodium-dependent dicarboxylate transporter SdcS [Moorella thermoacetica]